jgi:cytoplasmic iron level regulating protein YaaA (DUF328/UPF0246 family)
MAVDLDRQRERVLRGLTGAMRQNQAARAKLLGVKGDALAAATTANREVRSAPTAPAIERYTGVLYDELDVASLRAPQRRQLDLSVLIFSGLWGLVAPSDPIPDYKLKMGASLAGIGRLASWWRDPISAQLAEMSEGRTVWNLLPNEHDSAWQPADGRTQIAVRFLERRADGSLVAVSHWNKLLKGALVRHLLEDPAADPDSLVAWEHPLGYRIDPSRTQVTGSITAVTFVQE